VARRGLRTGLVFLCAVALPAAMTTAASPGAAAATCVAPDPARETVLLIHGWNAMPSQMNTMVANFRCAGYPAYSVPMPAIDSRTGAPERNVIGQTIESNDNYVNAETIRSYVEKIRAADPEHKKVALVTYSMGGLAARYFLHVLGGAGSVDRYVGLGVPEHGTDLPSTSGANALLDYGVCEFLGWSDGGQMCRDGFTLRASDKPRPNAFLEALNSGDETPGTVAYTSIRSSGSDSALLHGACDVADTGVNHLAYPTDPAVFAIVLGAIEGAPCRGTAVPDAVTRPAASPAAQP
jgi:triacylglycerol lipase